MIALDWVICIVPITNVHDLDVLDGYRPCPIHQLGKRAHRGVLSEEAHRFGVTDVQLVRERVVWPNRIYKVALKRLSQENRAWATTSIVHLSLYRRS